MYEENPTVATRKGFCESKPSSVIANNLKQKKKQIKHWHFLSMLFKALAFFADVKREVLKAQRHSITASKLIKIIC